MRKKKSIQGLRENRDSLFWKVNDIEKPLTSLEFVISSSPTEPVHRWTFYFILGIAQVLWNCSWKAVKCKRRVKWEGTIPAQSNDKAGTTERKLSEQWNKNSQIPKTPHLSAGLFGERKTVENLQSALISEWWIQVSTKILHIIPEACKPLRTFRKE